MMIIKKKRVINTLITDHSLNYIYNFFKYLAIFHMFHNINLMYLSLKNSGYFIFFMSNFYLRDIYHFFFNIYNILLIYDNSKTASNFIV